MPGRCHDVDALEDLKVAIGFVEVADFANGGGVSHAGQLFLVMARSSADSGRFCNGNWLIDQKSGWNRRLMRWEWQIIGGLG